MEGLAVVDELIQRVETKPQQVDRYTLTELVGQGAFAAVFKAHFVDSLYGALKLPQTEDAKIDIRTRQKILSALGNSPFSPSIIDQGEFQGVPYVVEEYREKSLADVIAENQEQGTKPSANEIRELGSQLLKGIDYFHRLRATNPIAAEKLGLDQLTHGDIKPSNIVATTDARTGKTVWEFTDFGIRINPNDETGSIEVVNSASLASIRSSNPNGKANANVYASPEVQKALLLQEMPPATVMSDLWSIGAVLFAYATGKTPGWGDNDPLKLRPDLPEGFTYFFTQILDGDPAKRYQIAEDARFDLERSVDHALTDSCIVGLSRTKQGQYEVFKQPMSAGLPTGSPLTQVILLAEDDPAPQIVYIPDINAIGVMSFSTIEENLGLAENPSYKIAQIRILDKALEEIWGTKLEKRNSNGALQAGFTVKSNCFEAVQRKDSGQLALRVRVDYRDGCSIFTAYDIPSFDNAGFSSFFNTRPGLFKKWQRVKNESRWGPYHLKISAGEVTIEDYEEDMEVGTLPTKYVTAARWVPDR